MKHALNEHLVEGKAGAFEEVVRAYERLVYTAVRPLIGHEADAEDACQKVFLRLWRQRGRLKRPIRRPRAWVLRIAMYVVQEMNNEKRVEIRALSRYRPVPRRAPHPTRELEIRDEVEFGLAGLTESQRQYVVLRFFAGLSYKEIALALGTSVETVGSQLTKARENLKQRLRPAAFGLLAARLRHPVPVLDRVSRSVLDRPPLRDLVARARIEEGAIERSVPPDVGRFQTHLGGTAAAVAGAALVAGLAWSLLIGPALRRSESGESRIASAPDSVRGGMASGVRAFARRAVAGRAVQVVDAISREPVIGAALTLADGRTERAGADGRIAVGGEAGGFARIEAEGYVGTRLRLAGARDLVTVSLSPARAVSGKAVAFETWEPVPRPVLRISAGGGRPLCEAVGDEGGEFAISLGPYASELEGGDGITLAVEAEGFLATAFPVSDRELADPEPRLFDLIPADEIDGLLADGEGRPIAGGTVYAQWRVTAVNYARWCETSARSGRDGRFALPCPARWDAGRILALAPGKAWLRRGIDPDGIDGGEFRLGLADPVAFRGIVLNEAGGGIAGVRVRLVPLAGRVDPWQDWEIARYLSWSDGVLPHRAETDTFGSLEITGMPPGRYKVELVHEGYYPAEGTAQTADVRPGGPEWVAYMAQGQAISGRVVLGDGSLKGQATVSLYEAAGERRKRLGPFPVSPEATFSTGPLAPGQYRIKAFAGGRRSDAVLARPGESGVILRILGEAPASLPGCLDLSLRFQEEQVSSRAIDLHVRFDGTWLTDGIRMDYREPGHVVVTGLPLEPVDLLVSTPFTAPLFLEGITPSAGENAAPINVDLRKGSTWCGTVSIEGGEAPSRGDVDLLDPSGSIVLRSARIESGGRFAWASIEAGSYIARVVIDGPAWETGITLTEGTPIALRIPREAVAASSQASVGGLSHRQRAALRPGR